MSPRRNRLPAAVVAVVVLLAACDDGEDRREAPPAAIPSTAAPESTPPLGPMAWVDSLPVGPPPAIGYAIGHTFYPAGGRTVRLPRGFGITSIAQLGGGYVVTSDHAFEGSTGVYQLDHHGRIDLAAGRPGHVPGAATVSAYPVLSADGATLHWLTFTPPETGLDLPTLLHTGDVATGTASTVELDIGASFLTSVAGLVRDQVVIRTGWGGRGEAWISDGTSELSRTPALDRASLISPRNGLVAVAVGQDAIGVLDFATRRLLWRRPHSNAMAFSPTGRQLLVAHRRRISVVDARTGRVRHDVGAPPYRRAQWYSDQLAWEDERHLLAGIELEHRAAVVRIEVETGDVELAVDWTPTEETLYVTFETRP